MADIQVIIASGDVPRGVSYPSAPTTNMLFFRTDFRCFFLWDGAAWQQCSAGSFTSFPGSPTEGLMVYHSVFHAHYIWFTSFGWLQTGVGLYTNAFPPGPATNLRVIRSDTAGMYHWDGSKWVLDTEEPSFYISGTPAQTFNSGTPTVLTGSSTAITNLGQAKLLMTLTLLGTNQFVTTNNCAVYIDGVQQHIFATGAVTLISQPITDLAALAAATHTVDVRIWGTGGGSVTVSAFTLLWRVVRG